MNNLLQERRERGKDTFLCINYMLPRAIIMTVTTFPTWQIIVFLLIDFIIFASIVAAVFFLILFFKTRKEKNIKVVDLNDLEAFKNKNLQMETAISIENNKPVAPSTLQASFTFEQPLEKYSVPVRSMDNDSNRLFSCQMQQNEQYMNDTAFISSQGEANTNFVNM